MLNVVVIGAEVGFSSRIKPGRGLPEQSHQRDAEGSGDLLPELQQHVRQPGECVRVRLEIVLCVHNRQPFLRLQHRNESHLVHKSTLRLIPGEATNGTEPLNFHVA